MKFKILITLAVFLQLSNTFSGTEGGGGDVVILPDDSVVLADPWISNSAQQPNNMPPLRALNPRLLQLAGLYHKSISSLLIELSPSRWTSDIAGEMIKLSKRDTKLRFYAVQNANELNDFCASGGKKTYKLPAGHTVSQVACTAGDETFLIEPLFLRMSLKEQVLLLIHERLTTLRDQFGGKNYSAIARFTTGLGRYIEIYKAAAKGINSQLSDAEAKMITEFYIATEEIQFRDANPTEESFQWSAHANGGGRVHNYAQVHPTALISIHSKINKNVIIGSDSKIINTDIPAGTEIGSDTLIKDSKITRGTGNIRIGNNNYISKSEIYSYADLTISDDQKLENGKIHTNYQEQYLPLGHKQPAPVILNWTGNPHERHSDINNGLEMYFKNLESTQLKLSPKIRKSSLFGNKYTVTLTYSINMISNLNTDDTINIVSDGKIFKAGYEKRFKFFPDTSTSYTDTVILKEINLKLSSLGFASNSYGYEFPTL